MKLMPDRRRKNCVCCGKHVDEVGPLSWTGLCQTDYIAIVDENNRSIRDKQGYPHLRRLQGYLKMIEREGERLTT